MDPLEYGVINQHDKASPVVVCARHGQLEEIGWVGSLRRLFEIIEAHEAEAHGESTSASTVHVDVDYDGMIEVNPADRMMLDGEGSPYLVWRIPYSHAECVADTLEGVDEARAALEVLVEAEVLEYAAGGWLRMTEASSP